MGLWRPIAGPGVRHPDRPAGAARPLGSPAEERVEEGVGHGLRQEHHQEGYHLQGRGPKRSNLVLMGINIVFL